MPTLPTSLNEGSKIEVKINSQTVIEGNAKDTIDYFAKTLTEQYQKTLVKRNVISQSVTIGYRIILMVGIVKFYPEILQVLIHLKNVFLDIGR